MRWRVLPVHDEPVGDRIHESAGEGERGDAAKALHEDYLRAAQPQQPEEKRRVAQRDTRAWSR